MEWICHLGFHNILQNARKLQKFARNIFFFLIVYIFLYLSVEQQS